MPVVHFAAAEQGFDAGWEDAPANHAGAAPAPHGTAGAVLDKRLRAAWIASFMVLALIFGSAVLWRGSVMAGWPASERLYSLLGMRIVAPPPKTADAAQPGGAH